MNIPFTSDIAWVPLPIDSQDLVTKVRLVVAGSAGGEEPVSLEASMFDMVDSVVTDRRVWSHNMAPVVYEYTDAAHATYGAERSFSVSPLSNPFLRPQDLTYDDPEDDSGAVEAVRDGDAETYYEVTLEDSVSWQLIWSQVSAAVGWSLMYALDREDVALSPFPEYLAAGVNLRHASRDSGNTTGVAVNRWWLLPKTENVETLAEMRAIANHDARALAVNNPDQTVRSATLMMRTASFEGNYFTGTLRVHHFYPLVLNTALLEATAKKLIRLPHTSPKRVTVPYVVPAEAEHTLVGWPGGDLTAAVARTQWIDGTTVIDFEAPGAPLTVDTDGSVVVVAAEAVEAERVRRNHTAEELRRGTYKLLMGRY